MTKRPRDDVLALLILGIVASLCLYYFSSVNPCLVPGSPWYPGVVACTWTGPSHTRLVHFEMVGTFQVVYSPCPVNVQCNPQYELLATDGNTYQLLFSSGTTLPSAGQRIEIIGSITYDTMGSCVLNGESTPCQPVGTVIVSSWQFAS